MSARHKNQDSASSTNKMSYSEEIKGPCGRVHTSSGLLKDSFYVLETKNQDLVSSRHKNQDYIS